MALSNENGSNGLVMPVQPLGGGYGYGGGYGIPYAVPVSYGFGGNSGGFGGYGGDLSGLIVLFLFAAMFGGFGNGGFGGGMGGNMFPWLLTGQAGINANTNAGFDNAALASQLSGIQTSLTNGFANAEVASCNRAIDNMQTAYTNQIASMNQNFANQQALDSRLYAMQSAQQDCCCENRLGIANLTSTVLSENCADRAALSDGIRDVITNQTANTQRILDQLCADKIDAKNEKIADLERQLTMANLSASQIAQTAQIQRGQVAEVDALYQRLKDCPVPTQPVYGSQPIFTCPNNNWNNGCGCGCGNNGFNGSF